MGERICIIEHATCTVLSDIDVASRPQVGEVLSVNDHGLVTSRKVLFVVPYLSYSEVRVDLANKVCPSSIEDLTTDQRSALHDEAVHLLYPDFREPYTMGDVAVDVLEHALFTVWRLTQFGGGSPSTIEGAAVEGPLDRLHDAFTGGSIE